MKKIAFIDKNKIVNYMGGVEKVICGFANEFVKRGYDVYIICLDTEQGVPAFCLNENVKFINLCYSYGEYNYNHFKYEIIKIQREVMRGIMGRKMSFCGKKFFDPKEKYFYDEFHERLTKCLLDIRPDIILPTDVESTVVVNDVLKQVNKNTPVISMCHSDPEYLAYTEKGICALKKASKVQVLLPQFVEFFHNMGVYNTAVIPNAVDMLDIKSRDMSHGNKTIINVARIDGGGKRQDIVIEAFAAIAKEFPDWRVEFWGNIANSGYKRKLDRMIKGYGLGDCVSFKGTTNDMLSVYQHADIFAFPSMHEGFGIAMVEAMSAGVPVIAYRNCKGPAAIIVDEVNGILCEDGVEEFAKKLRMLMENSSLRKEIGKQARESVQKYSPKNVWTKWNSIINECILSKGISHVEVK